MENKANGFDKFFKTVNWIKPETIIIYSKLKSFKEFFEKDLTRKNSCV